MASYCEDGGRGPLPPASYRLAYTFKEKSPATAPSAAAASGAAVEGTGGRGVYSFCMCPGGQIVPTAMEEGTLCVNGTRRSLLPTLPRPLSNSSSLGLPPYPSSAIPSSPSLGLPPLHPPSASLPHLRISSPLLLTLAGMSYSNRGSKWANSAVRHLRRHRNLRLPLPFL